MACHISLGHANFQKCAQVLGEPLPSPPPQCITCLRAKTNRNPVRIFYHIPKHAGPGRWINSDLAGPVATPCVTPAGARYAILYQCRYSRFLVVFLLTNKSQGPATLAKFHQLCRTIPRTTDISFEDGSLLHADNEFDTQPWREALAKIKVALDTCMNHTPEGNGQLERMWQTLFDAVRAILYYYGLDHDMWGLALRHAVWTYNRLPISSSSDITPYEKFTGYPVDKEYLKNLPAFGTPAFVAHNPVPARKKLEEKGRQGIFVGSHPPNSGHLIFFRATNTTISTQHVTYGPALDEPNALPITPGLLALLPFTNDLPAQTGSSETCDGGTICAPGQNAVSDASPQQAGVLSKCLEQEPISDALRHLLLKDSCRTPSLAEAPISNTLRQLLLTDRRVLTVPTPPAPSAIPSSTGLGMISSSDIPPPASTPFDEDVVEGHMRFLSSTAPIHFNQGDNPTGPRLAVHEETNVVTSFNDNPLIKLDYYYTLLTETQQADLTVPRNFREATTPVNASRWDPAITKERDKCLAAMEPVYSYDDMSGAKPFWSKWVFKTDTADWTPKGRLVILGNRQVPGQDFDANAISSPVAAIGTSRLLLAFAHANGWEGKTHADIAGAFLTADVPEDNDPIFLRVPDGFPATDKKTGRRILAYRLRKSLYGLRQAPRWFYDHLHALLLKYGFKQATCEPCLYTRHLGTIKAIILSVVVDDLLAIACKKATINSFREQLSQDVKLSLFEDVEHYLGMHVIDTPVCLTIDQEDYIDRLLFRVSMTDCKACDTPMAEEDLQPAQDQDVLSTSDRQFFQFLVGSLMHVYVCTRPEIGCSLQAACKYLSRPGRTHLIAAKRILRYLKGTKNMRLTYRRPTNAALLNRFFMFSDANWGGTHSDRRSIGGGGCYFHGALIAWSSKRLPVITLSSAESEYTQLSLIALMALHIRNLAADMGIAQLAPTVTFEDNQPAIKIATNPISSSRSRHIDIKYHAIREHVLRGNIALVYLETALMIADIFTKPLGRILFKRFRDIILGHEPFDHEILRSMSTDTAPIPSAPAVTLLTFVSLLF